jgi:hypothetical protein
LQIQANNFAFANSSIEATVTVDPIFTLDSLTPDASYITASGLIYETTPNPPRSSSLARR